MRAGPDRRRRRRELPAGPAVFPEAEVGAGAGDEACAAVRAQLRAHPARYHHRLVRLADGLGAGGAGGRTLAAWAPLFSDAEHLGCEPRPSAGEDPPALDLRPALDGDGRQRGRRGLLALAEAAGAGAPSPGTADSLAIVHRVAAELRGGGHYWVAAGAAALGEPLAFGSLLDGVVRAAAEAEVEVEDAVLDDLQEVADLEAERFEENLSLLAPYLHEEEVRRPLRLGATRLLDAWQIMLNGVDARLRGGVREL